MRRGGILALLWIAACSEPPMAGTRLPEHVQTVLEKKLLGARAMAIEFKVTIGSDVTGWGELYLKSPGQLLGRMTLTSKDQEGQARWKSDGARLTLDLEGELPFNAVHETDAPSPAKLLRSVTLAVARLGIVAPFQANAMAMGGGLWPPDAGEEGETRVSDLQAIEGGTVHTLRFDLQLEGTSFEVRTRLDPSTGLPVERTIRARIWDQVETITETYRFEIDPDLPDDLFK